MPRDKHNHYPCLIHKQRNRFELADSGMILTNHVCMTVCLPALTRPFMRILAARFLDMETVGSKAQGKILNTPVPAHAD